ncbi:hypothetical protein C5L14_17575 [Labrys okinawensis]|uniref:DUF559 domain-containing protein n=1 Tax=Labrys okinawensis TaxID=346911 RepID=A0A2S9Q9N1_9HYPH|nr:endonuclease domain-containing protein [Labrys okinawensis]PRH86065.1 hypothetical protein C5L14_17575 [Labrys okinawensis]
MRSVDPSTHGRAQRLREQAPKAERLLWAKLRNRALAGQKFVRQMPLGPYFVDFACRELMLIIEIDGATHSSAEERAYDRAREQYLAAQGYRVLRVQNADIYESIDGVCELILATI